MFSFHSNYRKYLAVVLMNGFNNKSQESYITMKNSQKLLWIFRKK